jgi:hypothetical protein
MLYVISFFFLPKANSPSGTKKTKREEKVGKKKENETKGERKSRQKVGELKRQACFPYS